MCLFPNCWILYFLVIFTASVLCVFFRLIYNDCFIPFLQMLLAFGMCTDRQSIQCFHINIEHHRQTWIYGIYHHTDTLATYQLCPGWDWWNRTTYGSGDWSLFKRLKVIGVYRSSWDCYLRAVIWDHSNQPTQMNASRLNPSQVNQYSICQPQRDGRLSKHRWSVIYQEVLPVCRQVAFQSPMQVVTGQSNYIDRDQCITTESKLPPN